MWLKHYLPKVMMYYVLLLRLHKPGQFKNYLVILSEKRAKWIYTA